MISTVAVGTDGSETADIAVKEASEIARRFGAKLVLLAAYKDSSGGGDDRQDIERQWAQNSRARVTTLVERAASHLGDAGIDCESRVAEGDAGEMLVKLASECGADLLVIGNRGMKRRVLGSVPNTVTHKAACSVLVVKTT